MTLLQQEVEFEHESALEAAQADYIAAARDAFEHAEQLVSPEWVVALHALKARLDASFLALTGVLVPAL